MNIGTEVIELDSAQSPVITIDKNNSPPKRQIERSPSKSSVNFGGGLELLMNDKRKSDGSKANTKDVGIEDLNELESQLNDLTEDIQNEKTISKSGLFNETKSNSIKLNDEPTKDEEDESQKVKFAPSASSSIREESNVGKATASDTKGDGENKTWDGFQKFNNIPVNPDIEVSNKIPLSPEEMLREKFKALRKLEDLERKGVKLSKRYSMESDLAEMQGEYEMIIDEKERQIRKFQGRMLMAAVTGLEFLNNRFDPFDVKLDGWSEQINEN